MQTSLYRFYDASDALLYVGISQNPFVRLGQHIAARGGSMEQVCRTAIEWLPSREKAERAERRAIQKENPLWNVQLRSAKSRRRAKRLKPAPLPLKFAISSKEKTYWNVGPHLPPLFGPPIPIDIIELTNCRIPRGVTEFALHADEHGFPLAVKVAREGCVVLAQPDVDVPDGFIEQLTEREIYFYRMSEAEMHKADRKAPEIKRPSSWYNWRKKDFVGLDKAIGNEGKDDGDS